MIISTTGYKVKASIHKPLCKCLCIVHYVLCIYLKAWVKCFLEAYGLSCNHMHQWTALNSRKNCLVEIKPVSSLLIAKNHTASRSPECLMGCCGNYICIRYRAHMKSCRNKTCNMRHVYHENSSYLICNLTEFLKIYSSCICTGTRYNKLRAALLGNS